MLEIKQVDNIFILKFNSPRKLSDEVEFSAFLAELLKHERFALLLEVKGEKTFSLEAKQQLGIWFKQHKEYLARHCFGFARLTTDAPVEKLANLKKIFPCPYELFDEQEIALQWLQQKLIQ